MPQTFCKGSLLCFDSSSSLEFGRYVWTHTPAGDRSFLLRSDCFLFVRASVALPPRKFISSLGRFCSLFSYVGSEYKDCECPAWPSGLCCRCGIFSLFSLQSQSFSGRTWLRLRYIPGPPSAGYSKFWLLQNTIGGRMHLVVEKTAERYGTHDQPSVEDINSNTKL